MHACHQLRRTLVFMMVLVAMPVFAQGTEKAIAAAVLFSVVALGTVIAGPKPPPGLSAAFERTTLRLVTVITWPRSECPGWIRYGRSCPGKA